MTALALHPLDIYLNNNKLIQIHCVVNKYTNVK